MPKGVMRPIVRLEGELSSKAKEYNMIISITATTSATTSASATTTKKRKR